MPSFFKNIKQSDLNLIKQTLNNSYKIRVFPYKSGGLNQKAYRKIELTNLGKNLPEQMNNTKKLIEIKHKFLL